MRYIYITPEEYDIAEKNGISKKLLERRIRTYGWDRERALTEPPGSKYGKWIEIAEKNGIKRQTFYVRVNEGMTPEEAATKPIRVWPKRYDSKWIKIAKENGISPDAFRGRVRLGWSQEKAATTPLRGRGMA